MYFYFKYIFWKYLHAFSFWILLTPQIIMIHCFSSSVCCCCRLVSMFLLPNLPPSNRPASWESLCCTTDESVFFTAGEKHVYFYCWEDTVQGDIRTDGACQWGKNMFPTVTSNTGSWKSTLSRASAPCEITVVEMVPQDICFKSTISEAIGQRPTASKANEPVL